MFIDKLAVITTLINLLNILHTKNKYDIFIQVIVKAASACIAYNIKSSRTRHRKRQSVGHQRLSLHIFKHDNIKIN